jgi:hypothetical protein
MALKQTKVKAFKAIINLGLQWHYTDQFISKSEVISAIQDYQKKKLADNEISLSVSVKDSQIVFADQVEPHLEISIINYPKFPLSIDKLKTATKALAEHLMHKFKQNRIVIEYLDETLMLEATTDLDPNVLKYINHEK